MYIWMMLAVFIVMLTAFNLSPRSDLQRQQQTPLAEASITKFLVQHDAAVKYAQHQLSQYHNNPSENSGLTAGTITGCNAEGVGSLCNYLPIGFKYEENLYYSSVYCLNSAEYTTQTDPATGAVTSSKTKNEGVEAVADCNANSHHAVYLITFGRIPERWKNATTNRILGEYYGAMHSKIAVGSSCGIVVPKKGDDEVRNPLNSDYVIEGIDVQNASIPPYFLDNDANFRSKCTPEVGGQFPCIIYVTAL